jgi:hypothetical protein
VLLPLSRSLLLLLLPGAKEFVPWDQVGTRVPELLEQIQVGALLRQRCSFFDLLYSVL